MHAAARGRCATISEVHDESHLSLLFQPACAAHRRSPPPSSRWQSPPLHPRGATTVRRTLRPLMRRHLPWRLLNVTSCSSSSRCFRDATAYVLCRSSISSGARSPSNRSPPSMASGTCLWLVAERDALDTQRSCPLRACRRRCARSPSAWTALTPCGMQCSRAVG